MFMKHSKVSYHNASCDEAHMTAEDFVKPCVKDIVYCVLSEKHLKTI
jgi:hypothetical protein